MIHAYRCVLCWGRLAQPSFSMPFEPESDVLIAACLGALVAAGVDHLDARHLVVLRLVLAPLEHRSKIFSRDTVDSFLWHDIFGHLEQFHVLATQHDLADEGDVFTADSLHGQIRVDALTVTLYFEVVQVLFEKFSILTALLL